MGACRLQVDQPQGTSPVLPTAEGLHHGHQPPPVPHCDHLEIIPEAEPASSEHAFGSSPSPTPAPRLRAFHPAQGISSLRAPSSGAAARAGSAPARIQDGHADILQGINLDRFAPAGRQYDVHT